MKLYEVSVDNLTGIRALFRRGDRVSENQFSPGLAKQLENQGFLKFITDNDDLSVDVPREIPDMREPTMDDYTRPRLMEMLKEAGIKVSNNSSKVELYERWKKI